MVAVRSSGDVIVGTEVGFWARARRRPDAVAMALLDGLGWTRIDTTGQWRIEPWDDGVLVWGEASLSPTAVAWATIHVWPSCQIT